MTLPDRAPRPNLPGPLEFPAAGKGSARLHWCLLLLAFTLAACQRQRPNSQADSPEANPTPRVEFSGAEVPPIDQDGTVIEMDAPGSLADSEALDATDPEANPTPLPRRVRSMEEQLAGATPEDAAETEMPKVSPIDAKRKQLPGDPELERIYRDADRNALERLQEAQAEDSPVALDSEREVYINLENADIREFIEQLHAEGWIPFNYILDDTVQGTITIRTTNPISPRDVFDVVLTMLEANGLTIVPSGKFYRIVKAAEASGGLIQTFVTSNPDMIPAVDKVVTVVVPLNFLSTQQAQDFIGKFSDEAKLSVIPYPDGNLLFLNGYASRIKRALQLLELVDIGTSREELRVYQLYYTTAEELKSQIEEIQKGGDFAARFTESTRRGRRQTSDDSTSGERQPIIIAETRSNRLIVFAPQKELDFIERMIELLDQEVIVSEKIYMYRVENAEAGQLASTLQAVYEAETTTTGSSSTPAGTDATQQANRPGQTTNQNNRANQNNRTNRNNRPGANNRTNSRNDTSSAADPSAVGNLAYTGAEDDSGTDVGGRLLQATARSGIVSGNPYSGDLLLGEGSSSVSGEIKIVADERTNALIIRTAPGNWAAIKDTLRKLDIQPKQVLIEVLIAEVTLNESTEFGIEWSVLSENKIGDYVFSGNTQTNFGVAEGGTGLSYTLLEATRFKGFMNAFATKNDLEVLSRPHLLVSNNTEATLEVGDQIPVVTRQQVNGVDPNNTNNLFNSIEYRDTGIILAVTPRINAANFVALDLNQEVSEAQSNTVGGTDQPIIRKRTLATNVFMKTGQTLLLGGIMQTTRDRSEQNVPWVRRIPVIKHLFGTQKRNYRKTELFIAITPYVLEDPEQALQQIENYKDSLDMQVEDMLDEHGRARRWWEP